MFRRRASIRRGLAEIDARLRELDALALANEDNIDNITKSVQILWDIKRGLLGGLKKGGRDA